MSGYILRENDPSIVLTADQVDRLVKNGDGDAALLYLLLMRADRGITEQELQSRLRWSQLRLNAAETGLQRLGLIQRPAETPPPAPAEERPVYSAQDLAALLEDDRSFRMLIPQVEEKLGRKLKTADLQVLAGLYDDLGMPADVIYLLVGHCMERIARNECSASKGIIFLDIISNLERISDHAVNIADYVKAESEAGIPAIRI